MKYFSVKTLMVLLMAITMSACGTISKHSSVVWTSHSEVTPQTSTLATKLKPLPVEIAQVKVKEPELNLSEDFFIPKPLAERAHVFLTEKEIRCMAQVIYFEARGEGTLGQVAVGYVVLNRMGDRRYPPSACGVVYQKNRRGCQFSWVCDGKSDRIRSQQTYERMRQIAVQVLMRAVPNPIGDSLYFRHRASKSRYARTQRLVRAIGHHGFYVALR